MRKLCGKPANLEHVLSSCSTALTDGRYRWRHKKILGEVAAILCVARRRSSQRRQGQRSSDWSKQEEQPTPLLGRGSSHSEGLGPTSGLEEATEIPDRDLHHRTQAGHTVAIEDDEAACVIRADSAFGEEDRRST